MQKLFDRQDTEQLDARRKNILSSPKKGGSSDIDSEPYLNALNVSLESKRQPIQFAANINEKQFVDNVKDGTYISKYRISVPKELTTL